MMDGAGFKRELPTCSVPRCKPQTPKRPFSSFCQLSEEAQRPREAVKTSGFFYHKFQTYDTFQKC